MLALWTRGKTYTVGLDTELNKKLIAFLRSVNPRTRQLIQHTRLCLFTLCHSLFSQVPVYNFLAVFFVCFLQKNIKKIKISLYMMDEIFELALFLFIYLSDSNILCFGCSC